MRKLKYTFRSGIIWGALGCLGLIGLVYTGYQINQQYEADHIIQDIQDKKQVFIRQLNQTYLNPDQESTNQLKNLVQQSSQIQSNIVGHLPLKQGVNFKFNQLTLTVEFQNLPNIPKNLLSHKIFYQAQILGRQSITWKCYTTFQDDLRPAECSDVSQMPTASSLFTVIFAESKPEASNVITRTPVSDNNSQYLSQALSRSDDMQRPQPISNTQPVVSQVSVAQLPAGREGIREAVSQGLLRAVSISDIQDWKAAYIQIHHRPFSNESSSSETGLEYVHTHDAYTATKAMTMPANLYGANSVTIFVPRGVPLPKGDLGHSTIYDIGSGSCYGASPGCSRL